MPIDLICLDADDTLWHNMRHYAETEEALLDMLRPFADARIARETLEACEGRNLKLYGYGAKGFTLSMIETALELGGDHLPVRVVADILAAGRRLLAHPVELLAGIEATLDALAARGRLVLVTKGDLLHQEAKLAASGLGDRFAGIEIVSDKTADTFRRLFARYDVEPARAIMAGDSMRSDVRPALEAGAWAAYVPHEIQWSHEQGAEPTGHPRYRRLATLAELPGFIDAIERS
jgi:putative hydrolase of the HAD superfamily